MNENSSQHRHNTAPNINPIFHPKLIQIRPNICPKSIQNRHKIDEKSFQNQLRGRLGPRGRFWTDFWSILAPTWGRLGGQVGVMVEPCWPKNWFLEDPEGIQNRPRFPTPFGILLRPILLRFWNPKWNQNRSKIDLNSDHNAYANIFKDIGRGGVFEDPRTWTSIKNLSKSCVKAILYEEAKATP